MTSILAPTYHIKPETESARFSESKARLIAKEVLDNELKGKVDEKFIEDWENHDFDGISKTIADKIKEQCKSLMNIPRYKIMVQVTIGQMKDQGVKITSRCLWDTTTDNYATVSFQNQHVWASAIVFAMYTD
jgi:translation initiation factor 2 alpha subunit (eIF-2alpha)